MGNTAIFFNGFPCLNPNELRREARRHLELDFNLSEWVGKANSFTHRRGVDPSSGYLLLHNKSRVGSGGLRIVYADGSEQTFSQVAIQWAKKITPAAKVEQGYFLAKVVDPRYGLSESLAGKRYNLVTEFVPPENPGSSGEGSVGKFKYDSTTTKNGSETVPWTWEEIFDDLFYLPGLPELIKDELPDETFPKYVPQDLDFRFTTRRDALQMMLEWTGLTILYSPDGRYKLAVIEDEGGEKIQEHLAPFNATCLSKNRFNRVGPPGKENPFKFVLYLRHLTPPNSETDLYKKIDKAPAQFGSSHELHLRVPSYYFGFIAGVPEDQTPTEIAKDFGLRADKFFNMFPPQEKTYRGYRYSPSKNVKQDDGSFKTVSDDTGTPLRPTGYLESVTWFDIGDGAKTKVVSASHRDWLIRPLPYVVPSESKVNIATGNIYKDVVVGQPTFVVDNLQVVVGTLPSGIEPGLSIPDNLGPLQTPTNDYPERFVLSLNTLNRAYSDNQRIMIFQQEGNLFWDNTLSGSSDTIVRFELAEDKLLTDFSIRAYVLDDSGNRITVDENAPLPAPGEPDESFQIIYVGDAWQRFAGYASYTEPEFPVGYGEQAGYRGFAKFVLDDYFGGKPLYEILDMEHEARYVETTLLQDFDRAEDPIGIGKVVHSYWDGRPPKADIRGIEGSTSNPQFGVILFKDRQNLFPSLDKDSAVKLILDEGDTYTLWQAKEKRVDPTLRMAIIIQEVNAASVVSVNGRPGISDYDACATVVKFAKWEEEGAPKSFIWPPEHQPDEDFEPMNALDFTYTPYRASSEQPELVMGYVETFSKQGFETDGVTKKYDDISAFVIIPYDLRMLPGFVDNRFLLPGFVKGKAAKLMALKEWIKLLFGYGADKKQSIGHDEGAGSGTTDPDADNPEDPQWQDDTECDDGSVT